MPKKRHKPEEIVSKLRQVDVITYGFFRKNNFEEAGSATRS